jgi:hypothetical protein
MTDVCRACKAPIVWAKTEAGRPMPLDAEPVDGGNVALVDGIVVVLGAAARERLDGKLELYRSHFATCPFADDFRRRP